MHVRIRHFVPEMGNPRYYSCYLDEDLINKMKLGAWIASFARDRVHSCIYLRRIVEHTHPSTMSVRALEHYCVLASMRWTGGLQTDVVLE